MKAVPQTLEGLGPGSIRWQARRGWRALDVRELWQFRDLLWFLTLREIKVRYKQTVLGATWAVIQPFFTMVVFSVFLGRLARVPSDGLPYPIFAFCGLLPWQLFSAALSGSANSLIGNQHLITKVYFPRLIIPLAAIGSAIVDFIASFVVLLLMMAWYRTAPGPGLAALPLFLLLALAAALAAGLWMSVLTVRYRDVRYTVPFLMQLWLFATPVVYPSSLIPERWRAFYGLNPMAGVVEGFRWVLLGAPAPSLPMLGMSTLATVVLLIGGAFYFRRGESTFADVV
jgi:lipopolysaccharide transport system permease protein